MTASRGTHRRDFLAMLASGFSLPIVSAASGARTADDRAAAVRMISDRIAIEDLHYSWAYHVEQGNWLQASELLCDDATYDGSGAGMYVGRAHIAAALKIQEPNGAPGQIRVLMQMQPLITLGRGEDVAFGRFRQLEIIGKVGVIDRWSEAVYENRYRRQGPAWRIASLRYFRTFLAGPAGDWTAPLPPMQLHDAVLQPDRPPDIAQSIYPNTFFAPFHLGMDPALLGRSL